MSRSPRHRTSLSLRSTSSTWPTRMSASGLSEMSCWPPASAWLTWWNKYGNRAVGWGWVSDGRLRQAPRVRRGRRLCGALRIMTARVAATSMIRNNGRSGHGVPACRADRWGHRSGQRRVPDRLRAIGRLASGPPGPARGARRAHRLPAAGRGPDSGDRTDVAGSREAPGSLRPAYRADARPARGARGFSPFEAPAEVAPGGRTDLRQGGSWDEGQHEQDGCHAEAEAHGDGLGNLVAVGLGLWSRSIGHYGERYTPVPGACRDDA